MWGLAQIPAPNNEDERERSPRTRILRTERNAFLRIYSLPLALSLSAYFLLTAYRDYRDNYGVEIFAELGYENEPALFTSTELPVALGVMAVLAMLSFIRNNKRALILMFSVMTVGLLLLSTSTALMRSGTISGTTWMIMIGTGSYLTYVPFGSMLFERIVAHAKVAGTAVFGIYLADALGYTGSICVQLHSDLFSTSTSRLDFFIGLTHAMSIGGAIVMTTAAYFWLRPRRRTR